MGTCLVELGYSWRNAMPSTQTPVQGLGPLPAKVHCAPTRVTLKTDDGRHTIVLDLNTFGNPIAAAHLVLSDGTTKELG